MRVSIAVVEEIEGKVSAVDQQSARRALSLGDTLFLDEVINTSEKSHLQVQMPTGDKFSIDALQSVKLDADLVPDFASQESDCILSSDLSILLKQQLLSALSAVDVSILSSAESIYDIPLTDALHSDDLHSSKAVSLALQDIFHNSATQTLDNFLRFDEIDHNTVIYLSTQGKLTGLLDAKDLADEIFVINSIGHQNNDALLSYLLESYSID